MDFNSPSHFIVSIIWVTQPIFLQPGIENLQSSHSACPAFFAGFLARSSRTSLPVLRTLQGTRLRVTRTFRGTTEWRRGEECAILAAYLCPLKK
jgi:hypothetical protein